MESSLRKKVHKRSREGCSNCRLRKVKCDERRPQCEQCRKGHITCSYTQHATNSKLQSAHEATLTSSSPIWPACSTEHMALSMMNGVLSQQHETHSFTSLSYQLCSKDLQHLSQFQSVTVRTFGPWNASTIYVTEFTRLAALNPFLLHSAIACTAMHGRFLRGQTRTICTPFEIVHWSHACNAIKQEISKHLEHGDGDALWIGAIIMSLIHAFAIEARNPEELWPLSTADSPDVGWLRTHKGVRTFWEMLQPHSVFFTRGSESMGRCFAIQKPHPGIKDVPKELVDLCGLEESSDAENCPYHTAALVLCDLLSAENTGPLQFLAFINTMEPEFENSLHRRDPTALVLIAIWYMLVPRSAWWIWDRAHLGFEAIRMYLSLYYGDNTLIQNTLKHFMETLNYKTTGLSTASCGD